MRPSQLVVVIHWDPRNVNCTSLTCGIANTQISHTLWHSPVSQLNDYSTSVYNFNNLLVFWHKGGQSWSQIPEHVPFIVVFQCPATYTSRSSQNWPMRQVDDRHFLSVNWSFIENTSSLRHPTWPSRLPIAKKMTDLFCWWITALLKTRHHYVIPHHIIVFLMTDIFCWWITAMSQTYEHNFQEHNFPACAIVVSHSCFLLSSGLRSVAQLFHHSLFSFVILKIYYLVLNLASRFLTYQMMGPLWWPQSLLLCILSQQQMIESHMTGERLESSA
jgi:hypothetical protein